jgi:hypothetical protein
LYKTAYIGRSNQFHQLIQELYISNNIYIKERQADG